MCLRIATLCYITDFKSKLTIVKFSSIFLQFKNCVSFSVLISYSRTTREIYSNKKMNRRVLDCRYFIKVACTNISVIHTFSKKNYAKKVWSTLIF